MGVLHLWEILEPIKQNCTLTSLEGLTLAVDVGGWICETSNKIPGRKPYIRNLFFRVSCLLRAGVNLIFVTEGAPPDLKVEVLLQRIASRYGPKTASGVGPLSKTSRKWFDSILKECRKMLEGLGIPCVQSSGEAEAMCAYLNMNGVVDGCISNDGDCFLYGGLVVYRNFTMDSKDPHVEMYRIDDIQTKLNLDRRKLVALALLTGCDYGKKGIPGIGKELALNFLNRLTVLNVDPLERFEQWKTDEEYRALQNVNIHCIKKTSHCNACKHPGTLKKHEKKGCEVCKTDTSCNPSDLSDCVCKWHRLCKLKEDWGSELTVMDRALKMDDFPNQKVIEEFLLYKDKLPNTTLEWKKPELDLFHEFMTNGVGWTSEYVQEKFLPLLSMWHLTHSDLSDEMTLDLVRIVKERTYKGVSCFDVEWKTSYSSNLVCLTERRDLIKRSYLSLVEQFYNEKEKKRSKLTKVKEKGTTTTTDKKAKLKIASRDECRKITNYFKIAGTH